MPNLKVYFDETALPDTAEAIPVLLADLRVLLCHDLGVAPDACQLAAIAAKGLPDQPAVNVELAYMPGPSRTKDYMRTVADHIRDLTCMVLGQRTAVRLWALNSESYISLK